MRQQQQQAEQKKQKAEMWGCSTHLHTLTRIIAHSVHTTQIHICNVHTHDRGPRNLDVRLLLYTVAATKQRAFRAGEQNS